MIEVWRAIRGYEGYYEISDLGRVRSMDRVVTESTTGRTQRRKGAIVSPGWRTSGHLTAGLSRDGVRRTLAVHRLVLESFVGQCPDGMEACHWNDIPTDNRLTNLSWGTHSANRRDCIRNGHDHNASRTHCKNGHEFTPENTVLRPDGGRHCRLCGRARTALYRLRQAA